MLRLNKAQYIIHQCLFALMGFIVCWISFIYRFMIERNAFPLHVARRTA